ncbi:unnamed protein product [Didymodactylos carnosus]|uniref:NHL repeat-containing protein n=1 Tax=Didymodactylos carnosus TaxID=1234261 RepID=A0A814W9P4_9BILA|nr:unnamed protein product [Didymodactylos carnosus]CAF3965627.1 unnamed protein product [Didymodactylos carnosus]
MSGQVVAGGNGKGNGSNQLDRPTDVVVDNKGGFLIICDKGNRRVVRWPGRDGIVGETIIANIDCYGLTMDDARFLYVSDERMGQVKKWSVERDTRTMEGILVAGSNRPGAELSQLHNPTFIFVDRAGLVYVSDTGNRRVMKWAQIDGIGSLVGGDQDPKFCPAGVVDSLDTVYVADSGNDQVLRWPNATSQGSDETNQLKCPKGLAFDRDGYLYVADSENNRVRRFNIDPN